MIGGYGLDYAYLNTTSVYDPIANTWAHSTEMPTARGDLMCVALNGEIYVLGGYVVSGYMNYLLICQTILNPSVITISSLISIVKTF